MVLYEELQKASNKLTTSLPEQVVSISHFERSTIMIVAVVVVFNNIAPFGRVERTFPLALIKMPL